jgi:cellulose synthase/poly-beta-1,6-N-acetylglucosamine synthase-like glycosyltransferase
MKIILTNPFVSIIIPTRNEEKNIFRVLSSIKSLNYPKNKLEILIVDGNSKDKTVEIAKDNGARVIFNRKKIRGAGCRIGVKKAKGEIIAFTDADCTVPKNWIKDLIPYLNDTSVACVGGPNITPKDDVLFAKAVGNVLVLLTSVGARYGLTSKEVIEVYHNPGCNAIYRKEAILDVGNFNSLLMTCEDEELDFRIIKKGYKILFTPKVSVNHYRRPTYKKLLVQSYRFAFGRWQAIKLHSLMAKWFHFAPSIFLASLLISIGLIVFVESFRLYTSLFLVSAFLTLLFMTLMLTIKKRIVPFYTYFFIILSWIFGWGIGFLMGLVFIPFDPQNR